MGQQGMAYRTGNRHGLQHAVVRRRPAHGLRWLRMGNHKVHDERYLLEPKPAPPTAIIIIESQEQPTFPQIFLGGPRNVFAFLIQV